MQHTALAQEYPPHVRKAGDAYDGTYLTISERQAVIDALAAGSYPPISVSVAGTVVGSVVRAHMDAEHHLLMTAHIDAAGVRVPVHYEFALVTLLSTGPDGRFIKRIESASLRPPDDIERWGY